MVKRTAPPTSQTRGLSSTINRYSTSQILVALVVINLGCFQLGRIFSDNNSFEPTSSLLSTTAQSKSSSSSINNQQDGTSHHNPLQPNTGKAVPLPSIRVEDKDLESKRTIYGGKGDAKHLGGWTEIDHHGISIYLWRHMVQNLGIKSIIDVGCGRGISTSWFLMNGVDALCVEGSHDAYENSVLPDKTTQMVEHDFSRGPWWPEKTYDAVWCVEFLEHVGRNFHQNYLPVFRKSAIIFVTHSNWGGWHHVEIHKDEWWIHKFELYGFKYMPELSIELRELSRKEANDRQKAVNGKDANPQNLYTMLIFFNPAVGSLPQHHHLFAEPGCFHSRPKDEQTGHLKTVTKECTNGKDEEALPPEFLPLPLLDANQKKWEEHIRNNIDDIKVPPGI